ncbi:lysozyme c-1-like [Plodia interpunctella]|uniref:lysozyme c-1-like n=1 Tax=Plodia interpunctella TaxID=58824 RepID=UPI002367B600|nr:lysozyme c-1-like [Plodia interpunctella]
MKLRLLLVLLVSLQCQSRVFTRCKLAVELINTKIISKTFLGTWVCLIEKVSKRDTSLFIETPSQRKFYGLYQIPQKWCKEKKRGGECNVACESLLDDDIIDDTQCASLIAEREGFKYWPQWNTRCKNDDFITQEIYKCPDLKIGRSSPERVQEVTYTHWIQKFTNRNDFRSYYYGPWNLM